MTLSKTEESSIWQVYDKYWHSYLTGDISTLASLLADDYTQIGSVETEVFENKKDAVHFIETTIEQIAGKVDMRNRVKKIELVDPFVLITEQTDLYTLTEGNWVYYAKFRASSFLQKKDGQWKFIHQHSSMPDIRADEGENIATEKISRENIELRDAIKRRTIELEQKNQELAMEASLERVRTMAMGMRKPDDLPGICEVLYNELRSMGFTELRNAMINIHNDEKNTFINYDYSDEIGQSINHLNYNIHQVIEKQIKQIRSTHDAFSETVFSGQDLEDWKAFRKRIGEKDDPRIDNVSALYYYFYSIGTGAIGISTFGPISSEKLEQLKRFRNVFEFAYRRYMDVAQAEAQAREAQIEASLERIRASSLAMRDSSALGGIIFQLYGELTKLDAKLDRCFIMIVNPENKGITWWMAGQEGLLAENGFFVQINQHPSHLMYLDHCDKRKKKWTYLFGGKEKSDCDHFIFTQTELARLPEPIKAFMSAAKQVHLSGSSDQFGSIVTGSFEPLPDEQQEIISRFTIAFNQAYIRFLDLQKAEAQAREAQTEAALERVRSRSMGMQKSDELKEVIKLVYQQLIHLKINLDHSGFVVDYTPGGDWHFWIADELDIPSKITHPYFDSVWANQFNEAKEKGADLFITHLNFEEKNTFYHELLSYIPGLPEASKDFYFDSPGLAASTVLFDNISLYIENFSGVPYSDEENSTLMRFGKVFQQTYTRFLDLQKAEAQARESQIELGLERVRARAMAMQDSGELSDLVATLLHELTKLDFSLTFCIINIYNEPDNSNMVWAANPQEGKAPESYYMKFEDYPFHHAMMKEWKAGTPKFVYVMEGKEKEIYDDYLYTDTEFKRFPEEIQTANRALDRYVASFVFSQFGGLQTVGDKPLSDESLDILYRFGKVFDQTYTRFLDLQKAEAQAREAKIEAALERVRSRAMAMQQSSELSILIELVYKEMGVLDFILQRCFIMIFNQSNNSFTWWMASNEAGSSQRGYLIQYHNNKPHLAFIQGWKDQNPKWEYILQGAEKVEWDEFLFRETELIKLPPQVIANMTGTPCAFMYSSFSQFGCICAASVEPLKGDYFDIINRFSKVFDQTYTRFLDLQKAEAQAREATIETSLERMRAKTMAMHSSDDVSKTAATMFTELEKLGIVNLRSGITIISENQTMEVWGITHMEDGKILKSAGIFEMKAHPVWVKLYESWKQKEEIFIATLTGKEKEDYIEILNKSPQYLSQPIAQIPDVYNLGYYFGEGYIWTMTLLPPEQEDQKILKRFAAVFSLTFRRYLDLKKAEAQALEAIKRASVDRVRAEIASMRTTTDLDRITPLIWKELTILGIPFVRCGVFIMDEQEELIHTFLSTPDGKAIAAIHLPYQSSPLGGSIEFWREKKIYITHWGTKEYAEFADAFIGKTELEKRKHFLSSVPKEGIYLHLLPFLQGMLYVGNITQLEGINLNLIQYVADAFSTAYARYEDFNKLEAAKEQVDKTLTDLKQAQSQLVQAEKMASLGELTAGIAHEIQNPLNFVNNFSEINTELSDEIVEAAKKGDLEEIIQLAADIKSNQDKISEHGKRADAIVKGMLQHSRSSSGVKEPTDINKLADEYFRLAYHGLRAKDKTFNATLHTDFDSAIGKIPIMPQDIGRVLLNLYNNAFYAVAEKRQQFPAGYEPEVSVSSMRMGDKIEISVKDNGNGIPQKVLDKIFQPFFTTKPTGQGTGLGLSLSYDIVKAHGGEIRVETKDGVGSAFIIQLTT